MASFPAQLALSALIMGGVVTGLYFVGQKSQAPGLDRTRGAETRAVAATPGQGSHDSSARSLLPARSWLVVDFDGRLTGGSPFSEAKGECAKVPPPQRIGLSIVGATQPNEGLTLLLVSPSVSPEFWRCVRAEVLGVGGRELPADRDEERLESPSGVIVHHGARLLFASERSYEGELVRLARGEAKSAEAADPHASLAASLPGPPAAPLLATLRLPDGWLAGVGPEAAQSPLRHLTAGALRANADGGAQGALECAPSGCEELVAFLIRARSDLARDLPPPLGEATGRSWSASLAQPQDSPHGRIGLRWTPQGVPFADWVSGVWHALAKEAPPPPLPAP
jgi:hypothetical protein